MCTAACSSCAPSWRKHDERHPRPPRRPARSRPSAPGAGGAGPHRPRRPLRPSSQSPGPGVRGLHQPRGLAGGPGRRPLPLPGGLPGSLRPRGGTGRGPADPPGGGGGPGPGGGPHPGGAGGPFGPQRVPGGGAAPGRRRSPPARCAPTDGWPGRSAVRAATGRWATRWPPTRCRWWSPATVWCGPTGASGATRWAPTPTSACCSKPRAWRSRRTRPWRRGECVIWAATPPGIYCHPTCCHARRITGRHRVELRASVERGPGRLPPLPRLPADGGVVPPRAGHCPWGTQG